MDNSFLKKLYKFGKRTPVILRTIFNINIKPAVFLHIQKTAGTSIVHYARRYYLNVLSHGDYRGKKYEDLLNFQFISGHFGYIYAEPLIKTRYSFTFLRDPIERVLSFYFYCKNRNSNQYKIDRYIRELSLEDFIRLGNTNDMIYLRIFNNQAWQLAYGYGQKKYTRRTISDSEICDLSINHLDTFSYVGISESFNEDSKIILSELGLPVSKKLTKKNVNDKRPIRENISSEALELLHECTRIDQILYDEAVSRRNKKRK